MSIELPKDGGAPFQFGLPPQAAGAMSSLLARNGRMAAEALSAWQDELRSFATERMQANLDLQSAIAGCRNLTEVVALQRDWAVATTQACMEESRKLTELGASLARDGMAAWAETVQPEAAKPAPAPAPAREAPASSAAPQ
jgi:hypothetical protein